jgi:predicted CopG family antitoxin
MATKTITVTKKAYLALKNIKEDGESFSDVLLRLGKKNLTANDFFGLLKGGNVEEARERLKKWRGEFSKDAEKRHENLFGHKFDS